jgi:hypothetical protein
MAFKTRYRAARTALVRRARTHGTHGIKALAIGSVVGAASEVASTVAAQNSTWVAGHWYGTPAVMAVGAYLLAKRYPSYAMALAGAAGFAAKYAYDMNKGAVKPTAGMDDAVTF